MTDVVAALIWNGDRFLACQRPAHKARGLLWEFVGGKVELGETKEEALIRECKEELGVTVSVENIFMEVVHQYHDLLVRLTLFCARIEDGTPMVLEHNDIKWITTAEIPQYDFCPADKDILLVLQKLRNATQAALYGIRDESYKAFNGRLLPTVSSDRIIGVRMPHLRKLSKSVTFQDLSPLPHDYYEEDCLHGILISGLLDCRRTIDALDLFLPYVDNWAVCDLISPACFKKHPPELMEAIIRWIGSKHAYTIRFGISMLMKYYLDQAFSPDQADFVASIRSNDYYVNMMIAWYFTTALAKQPDTVLSILRGKKLAPWVHNKTIQKAIQSFRIDPQTKEYLKTIRIKQEESQ